MVSSVSLGGKEVTQIFKSSQSQDRTRNFKVGRQRSYQKHQPCPPNINIFGNLVLQTNIVPPKLTHHSMASPKPSPFTADVLKIDQVLFFKAASPRALETSVDDIAPSMSYIVNII